MDALTPSPALSSPLLVRPTPSATPLQPLTLSPATGLAMRTCLQELRDNSCYRVLTEKADIDGNPVPQVHYCCVHCGATAGAASLVDHYSHCAVFAAALCLDVIATENAQ